MTSTLDSSRSKFQPASYSRSSDGTLLISSGMDRPDRWDGKTGSLELAGIDEPGSAPTVAQGGAGTIEAGTYLTAYRYKDRDGNVGNLSPTASVTIIASKQIDWSAIGNPSSNTRITHVELYRSGAGGVNVLYLVTTITVGTTTYTDDTNDAALVALPALAILDGNGEINSQRFTIPPNYRPYIFSHQGRQFACGVVDYNEGHVVVTNGSATVTGVATAFTAGMVGRFFYPKGATAGYEIQSVNTSAQTLTLTSNYAGSSDSFTEYSVRPGPAYRNTVDFSGSLEPEAFPSENNIDVPERADEVTGGFSLAGFPFFFTPRNLYRLGYYSDPRPPGPGGTGGDGRVHNTGALRGAEHHRLVCEADGYVYMVDRQGVHRFNGTNDEAVSEPIEDIFRRGLAWSHAKYWHAQHFPDTSTVKFFCMGGSRYARDAICFNYRTTQWTLELWTSCVSCATIATVGGRRRVVAGSEHARVLLLDEGTLDGIKGTGGTVIGYPTAATFESLTDAAATHPSDVVGAPLAIVRGRGAGQVRTIVSSASGLLTIDYPWTIMPSTDAAADDRSVYQIGGFPWRVKLGTYRFADREETNPRDISLEFQPSQATSHAPLANVLTYLNHNAEPELNAVTARYEESSQEPYVSTLKDKPEATVQLSSPEGYVAVGRAGGKDDGGATDRWQTIEMRGHAHLERPRIFAVETLGVTVAD